MTYKTIIFDFDYTLANSSAGVVDCINYALAQLDYTAVPPERACRTIGLSLPETLRSLTDGIGYSKEKAEKFTRLFVEKADEVMVNKTFLFEDTSQVIKILKEKNYQVGIVSTKYRYRIKAVLEREGLQEYFDVIVGGEDVLNHKPDPESIYLALDKLDAQMDSTLYCGDSLTDAGTAQNAGLDFAVVLNGVTRREDFQEYKVISFFSNLSKIIPFLDEAKEKKKTG